MNDDYPIPLLPEGELFPLSELASRGAQRFGDQPAMRTWNGEGYDVISYSRLEEMVNAVARWLKSAGINRGDRVAVLGENGPQWSACYLGTQVAGAVVVPVDSMMPQTGIRHIVSDSESRILFATADFIRDLAEIAPIPTLEKIVCTVGKSDTADLHFDEVIQRGAESSADLPERNLEELAAILYTSGTTGHSKGVMLTQRNIISNVASASRIFQLGPDDTFLSVLPVHHSLECTAGFLLPLYNGCSITYSRSLKSADIIADIRNTGVTMMIGVPLLFEKMHEGMVRGIRKKGLKTVVLFKGLFGVVSAGKGLGLDLGKNLFRGLRVKAGLDTIKFFVSGGGPLNPATADFFSRLGLTLMQGYGLTETSPVTHVNPPGKVRHETVGPPIPGVEHSLAETNDAGVGEVLIKGPNVFKGYYKNEEATREVMDDQGWFHTGDLGIVHPDNYLQIMGRKKNMIVTGGGKNVYPEEIEHHLNRSTFIAESLVLGVPRESGYGEDVAGLIFPDWEQLDLYFEGQGRKASEQDVYNLIKSELAQMQKELADYKRVRRFRLVEEEFQKTSTRKIKRFIYSGEMLTVNNKGGK